MEYYLYLTPEYRGNAMTAKRDKQLLDAAREGDINRVEAALGNGAQVNAADSAGSTSLMIAASAGNLNMIQLLFKHDADANKADEEGILPLTVALDLKNWKTAALLAERTDLSTRAGDKLITALHSAFWLDLREESTLRVHFLMQRWADARIADASGKTVLAHAQESAQKWPFAQQLLAVIEEYKDGPVARQQYIDAKRKREIREAMKDIGELAAPPRAVFKRKAVPAP